VAVAVGVGDGDGGGMDEDGASDRPLGARLIEPDGLSDGPIVLGGRGDAQPEARSVSATTAIVRRRISALRRDMAAEA